MNLSLSSPLDPGQAALLGASIGAGASVIVQVIAAFIAARHETRSFKRTLRKEQIENVSDVYEFTLNVIFNLRTGAAPDRTTLGKVFAQISLRGSSPVKAIVDEFLEMPQSEKQKFSIDQLTQAMQRHIAQLENDSK
jgi:hypothetical protein